MTSRFANVNDIYSDAILANDSWRWARIFGDLDNDGWPDLYVGTGSPDLSALTPNRMFRNVNGKFFQDVTTSGGFGHLQKGHGISFGDLDNDGDQDVYEVIGGWFTGDSYRSVLFENPGHGNHWITIGLEGTRSNRMGVGARVKVRVKTLRGVRDIYATVSTGGSFGDATLQQEIGLGDATSIETIEVSWPVSRRTQVLHDVAMDQFVRIREDQDNHSQVSRKWIALGGSTGGAHAGHR
jgi:ASPIC/UnbV protein/VCBS repeat protein